MGTPKFPTIPSAIVGEFQDADDVLLELECPARPQPDSQSACRTGITVLTDLN